MDVADCSRLGVCVLRDFHGNAVDAAVAVMLWQGVLAPFASTLGAFMLVRFARNETMRTDARFIDARETARAPAAGRPPAVRGRGGRGSDGVRGLRDREQAGQRRGRGAGRLAAQLGLRARSCAAWPPRTGAEGSLRGEMSCSP